MARPEAFRLLPCSIGWILPRLNACLGRADMVVAPHVAIFFTVLAFNLLGDGLRDALDPKLEG